MRIYSPNEHVISRIVFRIGHEEGVRKLYSGYAMGSTLSLSMRILHVLVFSVSRVSAALLRQATYGTIKIGIYQKIKRVFAADIRRM